MTEIIDKVALIYSMDDMAHWGTYILQNVETACMPVLDTNGQGKTRESFLEVMHEQTSWFYAVSSFIIFTFLVVLLLFIAIKCVHLSWKWLYGSSNRKDDPVEKQQIHCCEEPQKVTDSPIINSYKEKESRELLRAKHYSKGYLKIMDEAMNRIKAILEQKENKKEGNKRKAEEYAKALKEYNFGIQYMSCLCEDLTYTGKDTTFCHEKLIGSSNKLSAVYERVANSPTDIAQDPVHAQSIKEATEDFMSIKEYFDSL